MGNHHAFVHFYDSCKRWVDPTDVGIGYTWYGHGAVPSGMPFLTAWHLTTVATDDKVWFRPFVYYAPVSGGAFVHVDGATAVGEREYCNTVKSWPVDLLNAIARKADDSKWFKAATGVLSLVPAARDVYCELAGENWKPLQRRLNSNTGADSVDGGKGVELRERPGNRRGEFGGFIQLTANRPGPYTMDLTSAAVAYASWFSPSGDSINARIMLGEQHMRPSACVADGDGRCAA